MTQEPVRVCDKDRQESGESVEQNGWQEVIDLFREVEKLRQVLESQQDSHVGQDVSGRRGKEKKQETKHVDHD